ncbi:carbohydrate binding domain-containing protein [Polyangium sp. 6x1]|uniref:carbohydrate binding domain-containing protein n=1 Tax=Polyangium sp. 6x1 TaxID=3042689 RepID=UPI002482CA09|nr:carbohydrate binding domain-containing protein [Polyangium sp. 6x1]MDI1449772.1 carbohydrate binding domain-containing protein [Polyangium sp. 6x1]
MKFVNKNRALFVVVMGLLVVSAAACDEGATNPGSGGAGASGGGGPGPGPGGGGPGGGGPGGGGSGTKLTLIDDMEDQNGSIISNAGLLGAWYTYNDETAGATQTPIVGDPFEMTALSPARGSSMYGANTKGNGFTTWGAGFGFDLNNDGVAKKAYNASQFAGIQFWAKVGSGTGAVRFNVGDSQTTPEANNCGMTCSDDFGANVTLTADWQEFKFSFAELKTVNWSKQNLTAIKKDALYYVHFQSGQNTTFDIWVDDIAFYE